MNAVLLDTHTWAWSLGTGARLSSVAKRTLEGAGTLMVSPLSLFEIGQKVRLGKWPEMEPHVDRLETILEEQSVLVATLTPGIALKAAQLDWPHRDPFDRMLAATALVNALPIVSADPVFDGVVTRIW